jgi:hypothetical protein
MTKKRRKLRTWPVVLLFCILIFGILIYCIKDIYKELKNSSASEIKIVNEIEGYGYTLDETDSAYVSSIFSKLKDELSGEIVDEEKYATYVAQIFVADFYSLNTAINRNDIGGLQFIYSKSQDDFKLEAKNTIYHYVENNIYSDRTQTLPLVTNVEVTSLEQKMYNSDLVTDNKAFYVTCKVEYKEDLSYPKEVSLILVHEQEKLSIAVVE